MKHSTRGTRVALIIGAALVVSVVIILLSPEERSMGAGIRYVYPHVGLIWAGSFGFIAAGIVGLVTALTGRLTRWMAVIGWVSLAVFGLGVVISFPAQIVNWGGIYWDEPRNKASFDVIAVALVIQLLNVWLPWPRIGGLLCFGLAAFLLWSTAAAELVLHPGSPILTSNSLGIQLTFLSLFVVALVTTAALIWSLRPQPQ